MNDYATQTSRSLEGEAAATRARLSNNLDGLVNNLTPGHLLDEVMNYSRRGGAGFMRNLSNAAIANPLPTLLIGAGCALFLSGRGRLDGNPKSRDQEQPPRTEWERSVQGAGRRKEEGPSIVSTVSEAASNTAAAVQSTVSRTATQLRGGVAGATSQLSEGARAVGETVSDFTGDLKQRVVDQTDRAQAQATLFGRQLNARTAALFEEQPLLVAAGGLMIGAAIAAILPRTKFEDTYLGETSDVVKEAVSTAATEQYAEAKAAAGDVLGKIRVAAKEEDLVASASEAAKELGSKIKNVAEAGREALREQSDKVIR